jgi:hypothetical protein
MTFAKTVVVSVAVVLAASPAFAQRWGYGRVPANGVCFYEHANFGGQYFCVDAGANLGSIPDEMNDEISSMRVFGRAEATLFKDRNFNGRSSRFVRDVTNFKDQGWNDTISSVEVRNPRADAAEAERIVRRSYQDVLEREPDAAGARLYRSRIIDDGWSEAQVRDALRKSPEYNKLSVTKAQETVRRAYLNVLKREPDAGASGYVDKVLRQRWSQADVEKELRKSAEYRARGGK